MDVLREYCIVLLFAAVAVVARPEDLHVTQGGSGVADGTSPSNARPLAWLNDPSSWGAGTGKVGPGDIVHLWGGFSMGPGQTAVTVHGSGAAGQEIVIALESGARIAAPYFGGSEFQSGGAIYANGKSYVIIDGSGSGEIVSTDNGSKGYFTYKKGNLGVNLVRCSNVEVKRLVISNIYQAKANESSVETGAVGICASGCNDTSIHDNILTYTGQGVRVSFANSSRVRVYNNTISRIGCGVFCGVADDGLWGDDIRIYSNRIFDTTDWGYNDGIKFFARPSTTDPLTNVRVYANEIGPKISYPGHPATSWILIDEGWIVGPEVYNNVLIGDKNDDAANGYITVGGNGYATGKTLAQNSRIYNNTIVSLQSATDIGILLGKRSTGHMIFNNVFKFTGGLVAIYLNDDETEIGQCDNNCYYSSSGSVTFHDDGVPASYGLPQWRSVYSFDGGSISVDPGLDSLYQPAGASSAVVDSGKSLGAGFEPLDKVGSPRPLGNGWDMGAFELSSSVGLRPAAPTGLRLK